MTKSPEELLAMKFGSATVAENLQRAVEAGKIVENEDGTLSFAQKQRHNRYWVTVKHGPSLDCRFRRLFLFGQAYGRSAVPYSCSTCYKVKVSPLTLRQLVASWRVAKRIACLSKWGVHDNQYTRDVYGGYFYTQGLDMARVIYKLAREAFDNDPILGPQIAMSIRRGCVEYEVAVGPSDRYEFSPEMAELEAYLKSRFRESKATGPKAVAMAKWIQAAVRIGDDTYLDFTCGKPLQPPQKSDGVDFDFAAGKRLNPVQVSYEP
jgi:hypothetical protein